MAIPSTTGVDTATMLAEILEPIDGLRVYAYVSDTFRPPGVLIGQPTIDYTDPLAGFCSGTFDHPLTIVVTRSSDREAQAELARWLSAVVTTLRDTNHPGARTIEPQSATPVSVTFNGQELPGYTVRVLVRA